MRPWVQTPVLQKKKKKERKESSLLRHLKKGVNLCDLGLGNGFLQQKHKPQRQNT
jgi:hypothetical protein